ncbi:MAG: rhomboid family intramembrane serine protease [Pirellulales bacterium]|nr:rhomboid family intramembrane serine protease [Pirellulales bacterium]
MIIAPYNTDAPIYHLPIATVTIMVINVIVFALTTLQAMLGNVSWESLDWLCLEFNTLNPFQWISNVFMHGGPMHLIGNMIFLWAFGLVVEGKLGSPKFALLYLLIALLDGLMVQLPMYVLSGEGGALGASGVIFALMVIAVIWAPENEMDCFYWIFFFVGTFEIRLVKLGGIYIFMQLFFLWLGGFSMSSEMLHMIGVMIGAPIGFFMLRQDMVDCEGWDLVSRNEFLQQNDWLCTEKQRKRLRKKQQSIEDPVTAALGYTQPLPTGAATRPATPAPQDTSAAKPSGSKPKTEGKWAKIRNVFEPERVKQRQQRESSGTPPTVTNHPDFNRLAFTFRQAVEGGSTMLARQTFQRMEQMKLAVGLGDKTLLRYVALLGKEQQWRETLRPLDIVVNHQGTFADDARLRLAQVQLNVLRQPMLALQTLHQVVDATDQSDQASQQRMQAKSRLVAAAQKAISQQQRG